MASRHLCSQSTEHPPGGWTLFAKIFAQIYDSSLVESPETRFTFIDFLILADKNGVVDVTHEAIARRTNRPIEVIRETIAQLEGPDPASRTPDANGARIFRLDDHRDWGWGIVNYEYFRKIASEEQRRERTKLRTRKWRQRLRESSPVTLGDASKRIGDDSSSASASAYVSRERESERKPPNFVPTTQDIYNAYPRKVGKPDALKAIGRCTKRFGAAFLLERTIAYADTQIPGDRYTPHPSTWFNQERFNDDPSTWPRGEVEREKEPAPRGAAYRHFDPDGPST